VDEGGGAMIWAYAVLGQFGDALDYIFNSRESRAGGAEVGGSQFLELLGEHLKLSAAAMAIAIALAVPVGLWLGHVGRGEFAATSVANVGRAVPSLALIALFIAYVGVGFNTVTAALVLLAIPPIFTNTYVGVRQVDPDAVDAARGMGMTGAQIVRRIELPMSLPLIFGGIRTSVVNVIATATIAPLAGVVTLGDPIINGSVYGSDGQLAASILVASLAIAGEVLFSLIQRAVTPRGLLLDPAAAPVRRPMFTFPIRRKEAAS
jgi:osmoprotectant transport system permease protein